MIFLNLSLSIIFVSLMSIMRVGGRYSSNKLHPHHCLCLHSVLHLYRGCDLQWRGLLYHPPATLQSQTHQSQPQNHGTSSPSISPSSSSSLFAYWMIQMCIGDGSVGVAQWKRVMTSSTLRATFISSAISLAHQYAFDGIDVDWEGLDVSTPPLIQV